MCINLCLLSLGEGAGLLPSQCRSSLLGELAEFEGTLRGGLKRGEKRIGKRKKKGAEATGENTPLK